MSETCRYPDSDKPPRASGYGQHFKNHIYQNSAHKKQPYLAVIHRLDQPVEGLLVFAKTPAAAKELNRQLQSFGFGKYYQAVLLGCPQTADGILEDYLVKDGRTNTSRICTEETPGAKVARLSYHIAKTTAEFSLAEIHLDTGRHHQIRVQMAHLGCPIAGDRKYDPNQTSFSQLQLFACRLEFAHPKTKKHMEFTHAPVLRVFADETPADHPVG